MCLVFMVSATGCSSVTNGKRIVRVATMQSETHPEYLGLLKFKEYVEKELGDKYEVQIFPNEILGAAQINRVNANRSYRFYNCWYGKPRNICECL